MKLGLLVVFAVAALLPSPSESRIVSKCELKQELENSISVLRWLPRWYRDRVLARGEVNAQRCYVSADGSPTFPGFVPSAPVAASSASDRAL